MKGSSRSELSAEMWSHASGLILKYLFIIVKILKKKTIVGVNFGGSFHPLNMQLCTW